MTTKIKTVTYHKKRVTVYIHFICVISLKAIGNLGGPDLKKKCDILKLSNQNLLSEIEKAGEELVNTNTSYQRLQKELGRIASQANVSYSESNEIYSGK